jgi:AGCS family alanine or glycine:cation symporter
VTDIVIDAIGAMGAFLWKPWTFFALLATGVVCTVATRLVQWRALTHGIAVVRGRYDHDDDPGAITHFQALSAALSGTVGLGNIGGVALAIAIGGPGALFWMWVVGFLGMAIKSVEVTLALMYRNTDDPKKPAGGAMWVIEKTLGAKGGGAAVAARALGSFFCATLIVSTITGGNIFQAWNVAEATQSMLGVDQFVTTGIMAVIVGLVILGGITRIGKVAGTLVPLMCGAYMLAALWVIAMNISEVPGMLALVVRSAFAPAEAGGAFLGAGVYHAFSIGLQRALFSNEAGQGSAPIAHSAARTKEPAREGLVAGLEPFIDTIVICTLTALVILVSGEWNRTPVASLETPIEVSQVDGAWIAAPTPVSSAMVDDGPLRLGDRLVAHLTVAGATNSRTAGSIYELNGSLARCEIGDCGQPYLATWEAIDLGGTWEGAVTGVVATGPEVFRAKDGATLTSAAFDSALPGGAWLVLLASWLFAISTQITWAYYGEQGVNYLVGDRGTLMYRIVFVLFIFACPVFANSREALLAIADLGTGAMLWGNLPILFLVGWLAVRSINDYTKKLDAGAFEADRVK